MMQNVAFYQSILNSFNLKLSSRQVTTKAFCNTIKSANITLAYGTALPHCAWHVRIVYVRYPDPIN